MIAARAPEKMPTTGPTSASPRPRSSSRTSIRHRSPAQRPPVRPACHSGPGPTMAAPSPSKPSTPAWRGRVSACCAKTKRNSRPPWHGFAKRIENTSKNCRPPSRQTRSSNNQGTPQNLVPTLRVGTDRFEDPLGNVGHVSNVPVVRGRFGTIQSCPKRPPTGPDIRQLCCRASRQAPSALPVLAANRGDAVMLDDPQPVLEYMKLVAEDPLAHALVLEEAEGKLLALGPVAIFAGTERPYLWCCGCSLQLERKVTNTVNSCTGVMLCEDSPPPGCQTCGGPPPPKYRSSVDTFSKNAKRFIDLIQAVLDSPLSPGGEAGDLSILEHTKHIASRPAMYGVFPQDCEGQLVGLAMALIAMETERSLDEAASVVADLIAEVAKDTRQPDTQVPMLCEDPTVARSRSAFASFSKNAERFVARLEAFLESS